MLQPRHVEVADHDDRGAEQTRGCGCGKPHGPRAGDVHGRPGLNAGINRSVEAGRQDIGQHRQIEDLGLGLLLVGKTKEVEVGVGNHDVLRLAAHPAAEIDIAVGAARLLLIDIEADIGVTLPTGPASSAGDVERHRDEVAHVQVLDVGAALDDFSGDLVSQHHAGRCAGPTAHHVLVGAADVCREHLEDHAMRYLAACRSFEFRIGNGFDGDLARAFVHDASVSHGKTPWCGANVAGSGDIREGHTGQFLTIAAERAARQV